MLNLLTKKRKQIKPPQSQNCSSAVARDKKYKSPDLPKVSCSQRFHYLWSFPVACLHIDFPLPKATFGVWMPQLWHSYTPSICEWTKSSALPCFLRRILFLTSIIVALFWSSSSQRMHFSASVISAATQKCWAPQKCSEVPGASLSPGI